jgi:LPS-assembly protein
MGAFLPEDDITDDKRYQYQFLQQSKITDNTRLKIDIQDVSDTEYFNDFSSNLTASSQTHLNKSADLKYNDQYWHAKALAQTFETVDATILPSNRPYRRLPQVVLKGHQPVDGSGLELTLDSEWVYFDHEDTTLVKGSRATLKPGLHWLFNGVSWYIDPSVHLNHTQYDVEDGNGVKLNLNNRNLTTSAIDAGLFFERNLDNGLIQTLEPKLYYLNVPFRDQNNLPIFDTSLPTFNVTQLFRDNRFNGGDRIGDANQLTMAISSRIIDPVTGSEYMRASLGQITYFDDRLVTLTGIPQETGQSDIIGEIGGNLYNWNASASVQWDTENRRGTRENFLLHYKSDHNHIFNLGFRMDRSVSTNEIKQADISFVAPVSNKITTFARWNYSLKDNNDIDVIGGFSYDSCCWSVQLLGQRHLQSSLTATREYDTAFMVQLVLKGLGSVSGERVSKTLGHAILGYDETN